MNFIKIIKNKNVVILLFLILGVLLLKNVYTYKEGAEGRAISASEAASNKAVNKMNTDPPPPTVTAESSGNIVNDIGNYAKDAFAKENIPYQAPDTTELLQDLIDLTQTEVARSTQRANEMAIAAAEENATPAVNTVSPIVIDNSFFIGNSFSDVFCNKYTGAQLENKCADLTEDNCNITDCCVFVNGVKCMAGSATGPKDTGSFKTDTDYYLYKYQCHGNCDVRRQQMEKKAKAPKIKCSDDMKIISTTCFNQHMALLKCDGFLIPPDFSGVSESGIVIADNQMDISQLNGLNWGILKNMFTAMLKARPSDCRPDFIKNAFK